MMTKIKVKPLSLNAAYRGRRFTTPALAAFKQEVFMKVPKFPLPPGKLKVSYQFGVSTKNSDGDNLVKCFQDALAEKYGFNDKLIYKWEVEKVDVKKGEEFCAFEISLI